MPIKDHETICNRCGEREVHADKTECIRRARCRDSLVLERVKRGIKDANWLNLLIVVLEKDGDVSWLELSCEELRNKLMLKDLPRNLVLTHDYCVKHF